MNHAQHGDPSPSARTRRRSRRWAIPAVAVAATVALLTGCAAQTSTASSTPTSGGSLTLAVEIEPATLNPQLAGQDKARVTLRQAYENLFSVTEDGTVSPWLASGYEISSDGTTYTVTLRDGVTFWDGTPLNAAAVVKNFQEIVDPAYNPYGAAGPLGHISEVTAKDDHTVVFTLSSAYAPFLISLANTSIISPASYDVADVKAGGPDVIGTGPFILTAYEKGQQIDFTRNGAYDWAPATADHTGPAYLENLTIRFLPEASVRVNALRSGQVDAIEGVPGTDATQFSGDAYTYTTAQNTGTPYSLYFNTTTGPTTDQRVREAFRDAVDLDAVLQSVYQGQRTRAWSASSPIDPNFYDATLEGTYGNDVAAANTLLDEAGWTGPRTAEGYRTNAAGEVLTITDYQSKAYIRDSRDVVLQAIQAQVKQNAGIDFDVQIVDDGTAEAHNAAVDYGTVDNSNSDPDGVDLEYHWLPLADGGFLNWSVATDPELTQWLKQGQSTTDTATRAAAYKALQQFVVADKAYVFPLYVLSDQLASSSKVHGLGFRTYFHSPEALYDTWISQ